MSNKILASAPNIIQSELKIIMIELLKVYDYDYGYQRGIKILRLEVSSIQWNVDIRQNNQHILPGDIIKCLIKQNLEKYEFKKRFTWHSLLSV